MYNRDFVLSGPRSAWTDSSGISSDKGKISPRGVMKPSEPADRKGVAGTQPMPKPRQEESETREPAAGARGECPGRSTPPPADSTGVVGVARCGIIGALAGTGLPQSKDLERNSIVPAPRAVETDERVFDCRLEGPPSPDATRNPAKSSRKRGARPVTDGGTDAPSIANIDANEAMLTETVTRIPPTINQVNSKEGAASAVPTPPEPSRSLKGSASAPSLTTTRVSLSRIRKTPVRGARGGCRLRKSLSYLDYLKTASKRLSVPTRRKPIKATLKTTSKTIPKTGPKTTPKVRNRTQKTIAARTPRSRNIAASLSKRHSDGSSYADYLRAKFADGRSASPPRRSPPKNREQSSRNSSKCNST